MIFQHTIDKVLDGTKTQTRRIVKDDQFSSTVARSVLPYIRTRYRYGEIAYVGAGSRIVYEVGKTYAVQPGRGKKAAARMRIMSIRREDVRRISLADVQAEGFQDKYHFLQVWTDMHDPKVNELVAGKGRSWSMETERSDIYDWCPLFLLARTDERYDAWVLTFELVQS